MINTGKLTGRERLLSISIKVRREWSKRWRTTRCNSGLSEAADTWANVRVGKSGRHERDEKCTNGKASLREIPEVRGLPLLGTALSLISAGGAKKLHEYVDRRHKQLGPIYRERIGPVPAIFISSPQLYGKIFRLEGPTPKHFLPEAWMLYNEMRSLKRGLLFMDDQEWLHFRRILNKILLAPGTTNWMIRPCQIAAENLANKLAAICESRSYVAHLEPHLYAWSNEVMLGTLMGSTSWHCHKDQILKEYSNSLASNLHEIFEYTSQLSMLPAKLAMTWNFPSWRKFVKSADSAFSTLHSLVSKILDIGGDGLLQRMMEDGVNKTDLSRIIGDFVLAAGDTTVFSIQWAILMLSRHPEIQKELRDNLRGLPPEESISDSLLKGVIKETLRLYPTAPFLTRYLPENSVLDNYFVQKEDLLLLSLYTSGREASNYQNPEIFEPERWMRNNGYYQKVIHPYASLPFAMGARSCIGRKLAETQMLLALAELVKNFKIDCINKDRVEMILHMISVPSEPIQLKLSKLRD
ncbi:cytochrome P450 315a1, mitochondrial [Prorops nasuta]|uniref:cytochrome P450 315a1, mitochondrial n=1 Tax=Prorops nasuta TaxID=863751 RepID=UPI0034CF6EE5